MTGQLLLINPKTRKKSRKRRTPAQQAATRHMIAVNRSRRRVRRSNPVRAANPKHRTRRRRNPVSPLVHHHHRRVRRYTRRRSNPVGGAIAGRGLLGKTMTLIKEGSVGAGGALLVDLGMGYLPLPASMTQRSSVDAAGSSSPNYLYYLTKLGLAVGLGTFGRKVLGRYAETMAVGAVTINAYDLFRSLMPAGVSLGYNSPARQMGKYVSGMGKYVSANPRTRMAPAALASPAAYQQTLRAPMRSGERGMYVR